MLRGVTICKKKKTKGIILTTGNQTYFGSMAKSLSTDKAKTSFEQNIDSISKLLIRFMISFGLLSTVLDILCFLVLWYVFKFNTIEQAAYFQCGWFMFGIISQTFVIHTIRTSKIPFIQATASKQLNISTIAIILTTMIIGFTDVSEIFDLKPMPYLYLSWIFILIFIYLIIAQIMKKFYIKKNHEWI